MRAADLVPSKPVLFLIPARWSVTAGLTLSILAALVGLASGTAARATTTPSTTLLVEVVVTPKSVVIGKYASSATHDGFIPLGGPIPRGDFLNFQILNRGKNPLAFSAFGKKTSMIKPGAKGHFNVRASRRGNFAYRVVIHGHKTVSGKLNVV